MPSSASGAPPSASGAPPDGVLPDGAPPYGTYVAPTGPQPRPPLLLRIWPELPGPAPRSVLIGLGGVALMAGLTLLQGRYVSNQPLVLAVAVLSIVPVAVFSLFTQRSFVRGLTAGMGK